MDEYNWLESFRSEPSKGSIAVKSIVPSVFNRYFIIGGCYGIIDEFPFDDYPDDTDSIENLNKRHNIERRFNLFLNYESEELYRPVSIKGLAQIFGVEYSRHTLEHIKGTPGVSSLYNRSLQNLYRLVATLIAQPCHLYIEDIYRSGKDIYKGFSLKNRINSADEYMHFIKEVGTDYCSYLFPAGHGWCLISYEDVENLILACDEGTACILPGIEGLEVFEVFPETVLKKW